VCVHESIGKEGGKKKKEEVGGGGSRRYGPRELENERREKKERRERGRTQVVQQARESSLGLHWPM